MNNIKLVNKSFGEITINGKGFYNVDNDLYNAIEQLLEENKLLKSTNKNTYETSQDMMYEMREENEKLKKINGSLQNSLLLIRQKHNKDKARYRRKYKRERNILNELEKWLEELTQDYKKYITKLNLTNAYEKAYAINLFDIKNKLQELKQKN